ncbi:MAG: hypothetical protein WCQ32_01775 [bacterium]
MTHHRPHVDEIVAIRLLQKYGRKTFPGIEKANFAFWDAGARSKDPKSWADYLQQGLLLVGIGGGCFDEHPSATIDRAKGHCAATLVAEYLGISNNPELHQLLKYTLANDTKGSVNPLDLGAMIHLANKHWWEKDMQGTLTWALQLIDLYLLDQEKFFSETKKEYDKWAKIIPVVYKGRDINIVAIQSDDQNVGAYARSSNGCNAAVVIQQNIKKQVIIVSQKRANINFDSVAVKLRKEEARIKKIDVSRMNLAVDGTIPQLEEWYYDKPANRLLNGSLSAPHVSATKLEFDYIINLVYEKLSQKEN